MQSSAKRKRYKANRAITLTNKTLSRKREPSHPHYSFIKTQRLILLVKTLTLNCIMETHSVLVFIFQSSTNAFILMPSTFVNRHPPFVNVHFVSVHFPGS